MSIPKIPKIRTVAGKILRRNGKIAASGNCCCAPCEMTAVVYVEWECPCGGYGGADSETAWATFTIVTKDGHDLIYGDAAPSYVHGSGGSNSISLQGGETGGEAPPGYAPGESRIVYTAPCGTEILDENSVRIVDGGGGPFGGIAFSRSWDARTHTWTYRYRIRNGIVGGAPVTRPVRIVLQRVSCCWNRDPEDPAYAEETFLVDGERKHLSATRVTANGGTLVAVFDGGTTARVAICDAAGADAEGVPSIEVADDAGGQWKPWSAGCCKDAETGDVYYCVKFDCHYGEGVSYEIHVDVPASNCGCGSYLESTWRYAVDAMFGSGADGFAFDIRCRNGNWGGTSVVGSYPDYLAGAWCCCTDCSESPEAALSFRNSSGQTWDGARIEVSGSSATVRPRIPLRISIPATYCDGTAATADSCNGIPSSLTARVGTETIVLALDGSAYSGTGFVDCTSGAPDVQITAGEGGSDVWRYPSPAISSVACDPYEGWIATGYARPVRRSFRLALVLDATAAYADGGDCVHPMHQIRADAVLSTGERYTLEAGVDHETATTEVTACGEDPSCDLSPYMSGSFITAQLDTTNQPGVSMDAYSGQASGAPYSASWNASTNMLTLTWRVVCDRSKSIVKVPIPPQCSISFDAGWIKGSDWVFVGDGRNWPQHPPMLCDCLAVLDWPSAPTTMTCSVGYPQIMDVYIFVNDTNGWWALAQANGITDFSCYGSIDGYSIRYSFDPNNRLWLYHGPLPAAATTAPSWSFWGPQIDWSGQQSVPSTSGALVCSGGVLNGGGNV